MDIYFILFFYNTMCKHSLLHNSHVLFFMIYEGGDKCNKPFAYVDDA